jgi:transcriptional regulator with XRE-family HTH domain
MGQSLAQQIGLTVVAVRKRQKISQADLARASGVGVGTIKKLERGAQESLHTRTIERLARGLNTTYDQLLLECLGASLRIAQPLFCIAIPEPAGTEHITAAYVHQHVQKYLRHVNLVPPPKPPRG